MKPNPSSQDHKHHAIVLAVPFQGHVNPAVHLSLKLASRGLSITFLAFESIHHDITRARNVGDGTGASDMFEGARFGPDPLDIRYRVMSDGLPADFDRWGRLDEFLEVLMNGETYGRVIEAVREIVLGPQPSPNVLVADTFSPWASKIARKFELFYASFWTESALDFSLFYHPHLLRKHGHYDCPEPRQDTIDYIPGVNSIDPKDLVSYFQEKDTSTKLHKLVHTAFEDVRSANCVLLNTVQGLEPNTISALQKLMPFYPIGPIIKPEMTDRNIVSTSLLSEVNCSEWLSPKPRGSVLYVSFGSLAVLSEEELAEIAHGLMLSHVGFIWVVRDQRDSLPKGFEEWVRDYGLVVPWTNQTGILSHSSVGGFLTHCGWNSVLESVAYRVPMLCMPMFADQPPNRKLVVDDWKIGFNLSDRRPVRREEIAAQIQNFMSQRDELCKNMQKLVENALLDAKVSSEKNMDLFIKSLNKQGA